jgi:dihydroorotate dehydrogenase (fumarate)
MLRTKLASIDLTSCIYNASGCRCTNKEELDLLNSTDSISAIVSKSSTLEPRTGNIEPRSYFQNIQYSINSMGIPNHGFKYYADYYLSGNCNKPFIQSIYPFNSHELVSMFGHLNTLEFKTPYLIELNVSCPNVKGQCNNLSRENGSLTMNKLEEYLDIVKQNNINNIPLGIKLMPYYLLSDFDQVSNIILKYQENIKFITCINSVINGLEINIDTETSVIKPNNGCGGVGGLPCLPIGLSNVHNFNQRLGDKIDIVGCGGVSTGAEVFKYLLAGATAVQVGTALCVEGISIFDRLSSELKTIMYKKKYSCITDFKGTLIN